MVTSESSAASVSSSTNGNGKDDDKQQNGAAKIGFFKKLMLCAQLWGMEASSDFEQLYTVPLLQTLGMPLSLVSLTGLVAGAMAMMMLPVIGWLTDKGSNTVLRKTIAIFFGAGLQVVGMVCVITANAMHMIYMVNFNDQANRTALDLKTLVGNETGFTRSLSAMSTATAASTDSVQRAMANSSSSGALYDTTWPNDAFHGDVPERSSEVPFKAGLGIFGFIVLSLGFDTMNAVVRSYVLACSPRSEHTSLLVVGLIMASAGGLSTASLGIVDFTKLFGLSSSFEGGSLVIQTSLQGVLICAFVLLGLLVTTLSGRRQRKLTMQYQALSENQEDDNSSPRPNCEQQTETARADAFESSIRSFSGTGLNFDPTFSLLSQSEDLTPKKRRAYSNTEQTPLLSQGNDEAYRDSGEFVQSHASSMSLSYGPKDSTYLCSGQQQQTVAKAPLEDVPEKAKLTIERSAAFMSDHQCYKIGFKTKIGFLCLSTYFATAALLMFTMTSSDFVGKAIYGGDPEALPGSDSIARYQAGLRAASWGFIVYYATYLGVSFVHPRILDKLGCRVEFGGIHVVIALCMLLLSFTRRLEVFFFVCIMAGLHRACFYVVPYTVTNDLVNARISSVDDKGNVGFAMSLVTASMPLAYCSIFPWVGPLEDLVGSVIIPMWLGTAFCLLAAFFMILVGKTSAV